jgi:hypothetical protein
VGKSEVQAYANRLNAVIHSLESDILNNLITSDPTDLENLATYWENYSKSLSSSPILDAASAAFRDQATKAATNLRARAKLLRDKEAGLSPQRIKDEIAFSQGYNQFVTNWDVFKKGIDESLFPLDYGAWEAWQSIEGYDSQFNRWHDDYEKRFGKKASAAKLPSQEQVEKEHPGGGIVPSIGKAFNVPWGTILLVGGALGAGYILLNRPRGGNAT